MVVIAGSGISKDSPSNLPTWSEYNRLLFKVINDLAAQELENHSSPLDYEKIERCILSVSVSDYMVRGAMGYSYYPCLGLLEGIKPNNNHYALAELAEQGKISAIITTNFDTLIERAFYNRNVPYRVIISDKDFQSYRDGGSCAILKIHGSVSVQISLIDTITQKMKGLSDDKRDCLKKLFRKHTVCVLGFSGDDFFFDENYIPINEALEFQSIEWIKYPGSKTNKYVNDMIHKKNFYLKEMKLESYFSDMGVEKYLQGSVETENNKSFEDIAYPALYKAMNIIEIGSTGCLGLCIRLLYDIGDTEQAIRIANAKLEELKTKESSYKDIHILSLLFNIGIVNMKAGNYDNALLAFHIELHILLSRLELAEDFVLDDFYYALNNGAKSFVSIWINIGRCFMYRGKQGDLDLAEIAFINAKKEAILNCNSAGILLSYFNLDRCNYYKTQNYNLYMGCLNRISNRVREIGELELLIDILLEKIKIFIECGEYDCAWQTIEEIRPWVDVNTSLSLELKVLLNQYIIELYVRRNKLKESRPYIEYMLGLLKSTVNLNIKIDISLCIIKLLGCFNEYSDIVKESLIFLKEYGSFNDNAIAKGIYNIDVYGKIAEKPLFLQFDSNKISSKEYIIRTLIIQKEFYNKLDELPLLFCTLPATMEKGTGFHRYHNLNYSFYMASKRIDCGTLKYEALLRYSYSLSEIENFKLAQKIVREFISMPALQSEEYQIQYGCILGILSYIEAEFNDEKNSNIHYNQCTKILAKYPEDLKMVVYQHAHSFARKKQFEKALKVLNTDMPHGVDSKKTILNILNEWKNRYQ